MTGMSPAVTQVMTQAQRLSAFAVDVLKEAPMPLQPHTARLCQQVLRLSKGILTAAEEWTKEESRVQQQQS